MMNELHFERNQNYVGCQTRVPLVKLQIKEKKEGWKGMEYPNPKACYAIMHTNQVKQHIRLRFKQEPLDVFITKPCTINSFKGLQIIPNLK
jgi:hypothetical protein